MIDFNKYLMRHGECWVSEILDSVETQSGVRIVKELSLEERWDFLMNDIPPAQQHLVA